MTPGSVGPPGPPPSAVADRQPPMRRLAVGISVEALLHQWARQEAAPAGAALVVGTEIAARRRGGLEWRAANALAVGVLARPVALPADRVELGWLAAGLGAANAIDRVRGAHHPCRWPDEVDVDEVDVVVAMISALGPGRVEHLGLVARVAPAGVMGRTDELEAALVTALRQTAGLLDRADELLDQYRRRCGTLGRIVNARLLPHGSARGRAVTIDERAALVVESETGFRQSVAVSTLGSLVCSPA